MFCGCLQSEGTGTSDSEMDSDLEKAFEDTEAQEAAALEEEPGVEEASRSSMAPSECSEDDRPLAEVAETESVTSETRSETTKRSRGRPPGSKNVKSKLGKGSTPKTRVSLTLARKKVHTPSLAPSLSLSL